GCGLQGRSGETSPAFRPLYAPWLRRHLEQRRKDLGLSLPWVAFPLRRSRDRRTGNDGPAGSGVEAGCVKPAFGDSGLQGKQEGSAHDGPDGQGTAELLSNKTDSVSEHHAFTQPTGPTRQQPVLDRL